MTRRVAFALYPGCVALDVVGPHEVFALASALTARRDGEPMYELCRAALTEGDVVTASSLVIRAEHALRDLRRVDTMIVPGAMISRGDQLHVELAALLRRRGARYRRVAGVCTGAFYLAEAGLLDGRRAATHWQSADKLASRYPKVEVEADAIFVRSGPIWTSAGVTAGIDLALAIVEEDCGSAVAQRVARELVVFLRRPGGQSQFSTYVEAPLVDDDRIARVQEWIPNHLGRDLRVEALAARAGMSPRNFARVFRTRVGLTPARFVERARTEAVRNALESSDAPVGALADRFGFGSAEVLRRAFRRRFGVSPVVYRETQRPPAS